MQRPDPLIPCKPGAEDVQAMRNRITWINELFLLDGRDQADHPMRALYTGLSETYRNLESTDGY